MSTNVNHCNLQIINHFKLQIIRFPLITLTVDIFIHFKIMCMFIIIWILTLVKWWNNGNLFPLTHFGFVAAFFFFLLLLNVMQKHTCYIWYISISFEMPLKCLFFEWNRNHFVRFFFVFVYSHAVAIPLNLDLFLLQQNP